MAKKKQTIDFKTLLANEKIIVREASDEMEKAYISYAMKTIVDRALPDIRDGLKPSQRRNLYAMDVIGLSPSGGFNKSAQIAGKVMGDYHPHGDSYGVMVNLANEFSIRYPVVHGQGNFGFPMDGDGPAASRYTEAKLHYYGSLMLKDIGKNVVDFKPTYTERDIEPIVLPAAIPFLLINGASGIATGYATDIPSHNLAEVIDAVIALIKDKDINIEELMTYIKGPDLPTGGMLVNNDQIRKLYETGSGSLTYKGKIKVEENDDGSQQIVITELPPDVRKASIEKSPGLVEKIYSLYVQDKIVAGVTDVRDESSTDRDEKTGKLIGDPVRIVLDLNKTAVPSMIIASLYDKTALQKTVGYSIRAIVNQTPVILKLKDILGHFLEHRRDVTLRLQKYVLDKAQNRLHILEGLSKAFSNIDDVIDIIRTSDDAEADLMTKYLLSLDQVKAIMDMQLRKLAKLEKSKVDSEILEKQNEIAELINIINTPSEIDKIIIKELKEIKQVSLDKFKDSRRTEIVDEAGASNANESSEPMAVILTNKGNVKTMPIDALEEMKKSGFLRERNTIFIQSLEGSMKDTFILVLETGEYVKCKFSDLLGIDFVEGKKIIALIKYEDSSDKLVNVVTKSGMIIRSKISSFSAKIKRIAPLIKLNGEDDGLVGVKISDGDEENIVTVATVNGIIHRFYERAFTPSNPGGKGVPCIAPDVISKDNDRIVDFGINYGNGDDDCKLLLYIEDGDGVGIKTMSMTDFRPKGRVSRGIVGTEFRRGTGRVHRMKVTDIDFFVLDDKGKIYNQKLVSVTPQNRYNKPNPHDFLPLITDFYLD